VPDLRKWIGSLVLFSALVSGCAGNIVLDTVVGRTHLPSSPLVALDPASQGNLAAGVGVSLQKPEELHLAAPQGHPAAAGRQDWSLPRWSGTGFLAWTPWEGITFVPDCVIGSDRSGFTSAAALGLLLHTGAGAFAWGLEGRLGVAWARTRIGSRVMVSDPTRSPEPFADSLRGGSLATLAPSGSLGLHLETGVRRSPWRVWGVARYALQNPSYLTDRSGDEFALVGLQVWQFGGGVHRRIGRRNTVSCGLVHSVVAPTWQARTDQTARLVAQWRTELVATKP
jgi:hypothetical protein